MVAKMNDEDMVGIDIGSPGKDEGKFMKAE